MNITGKYLKVWEVEDKGNYVKVNLGEGRKGKDGNYENWTWHGTAFVGDAAEPAKGLQKGDKIEVKAGSISMRKAQDGRYFPNVVVFAFEVMESATPKPAPVDDDEDSLPF